MTFEDAERLMDQELGKVLFDKMNSQPRLAWEAFKRFVQVPLDGLKTVTIGFACEHVDDRDMTLWLQFARSVEDGTGMGRDVGCSFSMDVPMGIFGISHENWWWPEYATLAAWTAEVERSVPFLAIVDRTGWQWEGYSL